MSDEEAEAIAGKDRESHQRDLQIEVYSLVGIDQSSVPVQKNSLQDRQNLIPLLKNNIDKLLVRAKLLY